MTVEIITPDRNVFHGEASVVTLPGKTGAFQILKDHAPLVSTLATGDLVVEHNGTKEQFHMEGGVVEVSSNKVLILAEVVQ